MSNRTALLIVLVAVWLLLPSGVARAESVPAAALRALLTQQISEHVLLTANATQAAVSGTVREYEAAASALDANSAEIANSIALVYGDEARAAFLPIWEQHIDGCLLYGRSRVANDEAAMSEAMTLVDGFRASLGELLASANPNLPADAVAALLEPHVASLLGIVGAQVAGEYDDSQAILRDAVTQAADEVVPALAGGIAQQFPERFPGSVTGPAAQLQATLTRQWGEHALLAAGLGRSALALSPELPAQRRAMAVAEAQMVATLAQQYGQPAADRFGGVLAAYSEALVDYGSALAEQRAADQKAAQARMEAFPSQLVALWHELDPRLSVAESEALIAQYVALSRAQLQASADSEWDESYRTLRASFGVAAGGIAAQQAARWISAFPEQYQDPAALPTTGRAPSPLLWLAMMAAGVWLRVLAVKARAARLR